jgi:DNA-binding transcriptional ArsR family regulator
MATARKHDESTLQFNHPPAGRSRPMLHETDGHDCVVALRALGEATRLRIVGLLIDEAMEVNEIARRLGVSPYNASKHLRILREAGLLDVEKAGRRHLYGMSHAVRRSARSSVLDLGCCSFQFDDARSGSRKLKSMAPRKRSPTGSTRTPR